MNPEIKQKWLVALRSGEYIQTTDVLCTENAYCCLGVLCDLHSEATSIQWEKNDDGTYSYLGTNMNLPPQVAQWAGLPGGDVDVKFPIDAEGPPTSTSLAYLNDNVECTFKEIADVIEQQL